MEKGTGDHDASVWATIKIIEDEVLELKKQEEVLLTRLCLLQDTIAHKRALTRNLKASLVPVNRLPNEILLACFGQVLQDWVDKNDGVDERAVAELAYSEWQEDADFELPCTPVFAISHVSHHWRQLAINAPSLWTNIIITPKFERHMEIFRDFLYRAKGMPIAANFRSFAYEPEEVLSASEVLLMEAIMPLIHAQQINALTFLFSPPMLSFLSSWVIEQNTKNPTTHPSIAFCRLTSLSIFGLDNPEGLTLNHLRQLLSATRQLKTLALQQYTSPFHIAEHADKTVIALPMLENLTLIESNMHLCILLDLLSAPEVRQLKLFIWDDWSPGGVDVTSCLFINNHNDNLCSGSRVPRFPKVQNLTLSSTRDLDQLNINLITAFPRVTHLTLRSPSLFYNTKKPDSLAPPPTYHCLQYLTLDFAFEHAEGQDLDLRDGFSWLQKTKDQADRLLLISVLDRSTGLMQIANKHLFRYYKELQQYGVFDEDSSRLDQFMS
ncbi:hypothetical protein BJ138DRAFT_1157920 [Hygrophoropsis aurantiaca]|uniref:Uncharacterized protein n=1 Tax=Hygrophoropsis aurantiaca TaxID=72124 RepID=A0ACB8A4R4_9AGAM|nr:hypothetical protein BJ138DRAFT_1157920 [Hygrophoropsis aurantiaca]